VIVQKKKKNIRMKKKAHISDSGYISYRGA
jgi:hypothetical protein